MASWYERHILPKIIRYACACQTATEYREQVIPHASGRVLEIGVGGGLNFRFYRPGAVSEVVGIDPSPELRAYAERAPRPEGLRIAVRDAEAEALPFADASFDTVVSTYTLCTVGDDARTLAELRRVLRPGGQFLFCEHGASPDAGIARWQTRIEPVWKRALGGCHLTRPVGASIARYFTIDRITGAYAARTPRLCGWMEHGRALAA